MHYSEWLGRLYILQQYLEECIAPVCREYNINSTEMTVLLFVHNNPDKNTARDVIEYSRLAKANVSKAVEHLMRRGLLVRVRDAQDRRLMHLSLTETAERIMPDLHAAADTYLRGIFADFSPEELRAYNQFNARIGKNAENRLSKNQ